MKNKKSFLFAFLTVLISLAVTALGLEIIVRIVFFQPTGRMAVPYETRLSELEGVEYELTPNHEYRWKYGPRKLFERGFSIPVRINSDGYRGRELPDPKPDNHYRILALGDSFTLGVGAREEDIWVTRLENLIQTEKSSELAKKYDVIEVVNTGVGGWDTLAEYHYLRQKGMKHNPDAIILGFCVNDFQIDFSEFWIDGEGMMRTRQKGKTRERFQGLLLKDNTSKKKWWEWIAENSHLIRWISSRDMIFQSNPLTAQYGKREKRLVFRAVDKIHSIAKKAKIPLYICLFPYLEDTISGCDKQGLDELQEHCLALEIPVLRMDEALKGRRAEDLWVHPKDHHPNAVAHALYAEHIYKYFFVEK